MLRPRIVHIGAAVLSGPAVPGPAHAVHVRRYLIELGQSRAQAASQGR